MGKNLFSLLFCLASLCSFIGCASDNKQQFDRIKVGMQKDEVLEIMNSPQRTQRWHGMDRWTYIFYQHAELMQKEVHFSEGTANYVGDIHRPEISAEQQDAKNEAENKELDALYQTRREDFRKAYSGYEDNVRGDNSIRYVPKYTPVQ